MPRLVSAAAVVAVSICLGGCSGGHATSTRPPAIGAMHLPDLSSINVDATTPRTADPPGAPAPSPAAAVDQFVAREVAGDFASSYDLIAASDRDAVRGRAGWVRSHGALPTIKSFRRTDVRPQPAGTDVVGDIEFDPLLDEVRGLIPKSAHVVWRTVPEDGGWRIAFGDTLIEPHYPDPSSATAAVTEWVRAYQDCRKPDNLEYIGGPVGAPSLAGRLCNVTGAIQVDPPLVLGDRPDPSAAIAAFGPETDVWARLVHVRQPVPMNVVVAPLGDQWIVIGVLSDNR